MIQIPGYILTKKLGVGGMATVYLALQTSLQRQVALKVMAPAFAADRSFANRFVTEARTIAELNHPNIVAIHDVGVTEDGLHYFAMQHLPNGDFQSRIDAGIRERELIRVLLGICGALEHAHARGFVHRDVTPGNVLFDNTGMPVLTDFGIARVVTEATRMTATGLSLGTSHYMSPEQARGRRVDFRSDLYSLGAVTYEALVGRPPYDGDDSFAVAYAHVYDPLPKVPERLARWQPFIDRAMAKDPADRFQSAAEVRESLQQYLEKTSRNGRRAPEPPVASEAEPATVPLRLDRGTGDREGRLRWLKLAFGRRPRDWLTGIAPAFKWSVAWITDLVSRSIPTRWLAGALALVVLVAVAFAWVLRPAASPEILPEPIVAPVDPTPPAVEGELEPAPIAEADSEPASDEAPAAGDEQLAEVVSFEPDDPALVDIENGEVVGGTTQDDDSVARQFRERILELVTQANQQMADNELTTPEGNNALEKFEQILSLDEDNIQAKDGIERIILTYVAWARSAIRRDRYDSAFTYQQRGAEVARSHGLMERHQADLDSINEFAFETAADNGRQAAQRGEQQSAAQYYRQALEIRPGDPQVTTALDLLLNPPPTGPETLNDALADGSAGPQMVLVDVNGGRLAVGATEVTVDQFRRFMAAGGGGNRKVPACRRLESRWRSSRRRTWDNPGFEQSGRHPVVCVTWVDARGYAAWLSAETGQRYRLPSEAEWRALAAGSEVRDACAANLADAALEREESGRKVLPCEDGWSYTAPARTYAASEAGIFDAIGNVREWVGDCTEQSRSGECRERAVLGSSWMNPDPPDGAIARESFDEDRAYDTVGFRVVREM